MQGKQMVANLSCLSCLYIASYFIQCQLTFNCKQQITGYFWTFWVHSRPTLETAYGVPKQKNRHYKLTTGWLIKFHQ